MRFDRTSWRKAKGYKLDRSLRRIRAAESAVQREKDAVPLFPELVRHNTADARLNALESGQAEWNQEWRDQTAAGWRFARQQLNALPTLTRKGTLRYWQECGYPGSPVYLLGLIRDVSAGKCPWKKLRVLRQLRLLSQSRLPKTVYESVRASSFE